MYTTATIAAATTASACNLRRYDDAVASTMLVKLAAPTHRIFVATDHAHREVEAREGLGLHRDRQGAKLGGARLELSARRAPPQGVV